MANENKQLTPGVLIAIAMGPLLAMAVGIGYVELKNRDAAKLVNQAEAEGQLIHLQAQIRDLETKIAQRESSPAPAATPTPDPALVAALAALAEAQKNQQATLTALAAKLAQPAPAPTQAPAPITPPSQPTTATAAATPAITTVAPPVPRPAPVSTALNSLEAAYKQAWESGKPVLFGQIRNAQTGQPEGGRTLDPSTAQSLGVASWQEWYASEEKSRREEFTEKAEQELRSGDGKLVEIPKAPPR